MKRHEDWTGKITANFSVSEARCGHCQMLPDDKQVIINTANFMERIREALGGRVIHVNSWYRCPEWNRRVGGASDSQHIRGYAVDFTVRDLTPRQVQARLRRFVGDGPGKFIGGLGRYRGWTHVDRRTSNFAVWDG